jgi:hypothetical protein
MQIRYPIICMGLLLLIYSYPAMGGTPGETYKKNRSTIVQRNFSIFDGHLFVVINQTTAKRVRKRLLFRQMKLRALKQLLPRFSQYRHPGINKEWFELYFDLPSFAKFSVKNGFVVDEKITGDRAYLVLTVPEKKVTSVIMPDPKITRDSVNRAFDERVSMNLIKYSRVAEGERLRLVKERLARGISNNYKKETSVDDKLLVEGEEKPNKLNVSKKIPRVIIQESELDDLL